MNTWILCTNLGNKASSVSVMRRSLIYLLGGVPKEKMRSVFVNCKERKFGPMGGYFAVPFVTSDDKVEYIFLSPSDIKIGRERAKKYLER